MSGIKLQEELSRREIQVPIVFVSGTEDVATAVRAMKAGAVDFLTKPVHDQKVLDAVFASIERDRERRRGETILAALRVRFSSLTARERQVLVSVAAGKLNKQTAGDLGVSEVMVKIHRANGMRKLRAKSVAELIRMTDLLCAGQSELAYAEPLLEAGVDFGPGIMTSRRYWVSVGEFSLEACSIGMVV